jgi:molecular chaperone HscB
MSAVPDYFELYEMKPTLNPDPAALRSRYYALSRQYHPDRASGGDQLELLTKASQVNEGYRLLGDADALLGYVLRREGVVEDNEHYQLPPDFLMEMIDLNEAVSDAATDPESAANAKRELDAALGAWESGVAPLRKTYNDGDNSPELLAKLKDFYYRKKYLERVAERG